MSESSSNRDIVLTIIPLRSIDRSIVGVMDVQDLAKIFQRALNTWEMPPPYLLALSDQLEAVVASLTTPQH